MRIAAFALCLGLTACGSLRPAEEGRQPELVAATMAPETLITVAPTFELFRPVMLLAGHGRDQGRADDLAAFAGRDADIRDVLAVLFAGGGLEFVVAGDVQGDVSFEIHSGTRAQAFLELLHHVGLSMTVVGGRAVISSRERRRFDVSGLSLPRPELLAQLRTLLDNEGYGVDLPDGRIEVEGSAAAMHNVVAWLDGQTGTGEQLPFRFGLAAAPFSAPQAVKKEASVAKLGRRELGTTLAILALEDLLDQRHFSAQRHLSDALALDPDLPEALLVAGWQRMLDGDHAGARLSLDRAMLSRPRDRLLLTLQALNHLVAGRSDVAVEEFKAVHERWQDGRASSNLAGALYLSGRPDHALAAAQADRGELPNALHMLRAWLFVQAEWVEAAVAELDTATLGGARMDDEGWAQVLAAIHLLKQGYVPPEPVDLLLGESSPGESPLRLEHDVRDEYEASWH